MADNQQPIIVKRIKKGGAGAHGGAWKLAYADFVTAMMAFFLLMWLLGSTAKSDLQGIAEMFQQPLKLSFQGGPGSGSSTSVMQGGGTDLTKSAGEAAKGYKEPKKVTEIKVIPVETSNQPDAATSQTPESKSISEALAKEKEKAEKQLLSDLKAKVEAMIEANPELRAFKQQLLLDITSEGLRIQIVDDKARPMFDTASAEMKPYARVIVQALGRVLNEVENRVSVSGHTDAAQYAGKGRGFSNWELSANRANASRRELVSGGMDEQKIMRVVGLASTIPLDRNDPFAPINRRITLVVMNRRTEQAIMQEGHDLELNAAEPIASQPIIDASKKELTASPSKSRREIKP